MPFTITMPKLSPTMQDGTIAKWHKKIGDKIQAGDLLIEVATDKATVEYHALDDGFLRFIIIDEGQSGSVNDPIAIISEKPDENIESYKTNLLQKTPEVKTTQKPQQNAPAPQAQEIKPATLQVAQFTPEPPLTNYKFPFPTEDRDKKASASPLAKKIAKEKGLDLNSVKGSGPNGRITSKDLPLAGQDLVVSFAPCAKPKYLAGSFEEKPLTPMRKVIAERLQMSKNSIPHIYIKQQVDASALVVIREQLKAGGQNITINDLIVRACALALKEHPNCNVGFNSATQSIIYFKTIDISVAVSLDEGLITPIIRYADFKNLGEISIEIKDLATRAKNGKLKPEEYKGGSFTVSNLGKFAIDEFSAIINPPQAMILAAAAIKDSPIVKNGAVTIAKTMNLTVSADHRALDGADVAIWLKTLQKYLENPALLLV